LNLIHTNIKFLKFILSHLNIHKFPCRNILSMCLIIKCQQSLLLILHNRQYMHCIITFLKFKDIWISKHIWLQDIWTYINILIYVAICSFQISFTCTIQCSLVNLECHIHFQIKNWAAEQFCGLSRLMKPV
jgi:hypothetical protein